MVPDWIAYSALVVLLVGSASVGVVLALGVILAVRAVQVGLARLQARRRTEALREQLVQQLASGQVIAWLACHSLTCGHLETIHHPDAGDLWVCEVCGTTAAATAP